MSEGRAVAFQRVSKRFGDRVVLDEVSFEVNAGEALCILGRSGTGKSVTLKLMIGLIQSDSGTISIGSEDIIRAAPEQLSRVRRNMGFLFQSGALFDSFSLGDNVALPLERLDKTKSPEQIKSTVEETLRKVGLEADKNKMPNELSGGMRKRAGLARAMVLNPRLLLVDEPSSGLDRITASEIDDLLLTLKNQEQTSLVIVTHDVRGARRVADRVAVLDKGRLAGWGTIAELEKSDNPLVRQLISES
jgi:phospholipid/cholesterol/gamma-HCH transport system ATP-binding protein